MPQVDVAIVEVGMGGEYDPTNVIKWVGITWEYTPGYILGDQLYVVSRHWILTMSSSWVVRWVKLHGTKPEFSRQVSITLR